MRTTMLLVLAASAGACGARTGLDEEREGDDGGGVPLPRECGPLVPERFGEVADGRPRAVDGRNLWVQYGGPELAIGVVDTETGVVARVAEAQLGVWGFTAREGNAWWSNSGFSDFDGQIVTASAERRRPRVLVDGLFQPGGVQHDGSFLYFAEWTNSGSLRDERRGRIVRMDPDGGGQRDLALELGLPAATAVAHEHVYWVDRRRDHVARAPSGGGAIEVMEADITVGGEMAARGEAVIYAVREGMRDEIAFFEGDLGLRRLTLVDGEARGLAPTAHGLVIEVFDPTGDTSLFFRPWAREALVPLDPDGRSPVADERRLYWQREGHDPSLIRVCIDWLAIL